jgi:hypothetical protein
MVLVGVWFSLSNPEKVQKLTGPRPGLFKPVSGEDGGSVPEKGEPDLSAKEEKASIHSPDPALQAELNLLRQQLKQKPDRETALRLLQEFTARMFAANPDRAAATLLQFLQSGEDEATGLEFAVGEAGLAEWPSLRAFLLDLLGKIDPELASRYALETVIPAKNSTAEYAVSLQILWNHGGAEKTTPELTQAWLGLLQKPDWAARPDAAWVESLDFASRIPEATPQFLAAATPWLARPGEAAGKAEAAEMALERMMIRHPEETLAGLLQNPQWMDEGRGPAVRATVFARVDATDAEQVSSLKNYLQSLPADGKEAAAFYRAFPCHNYGVAPGLSGQPDLPGAGEIEERLRADLAMLEAWRSDPAMASHRAWVEEALKRVQATLGP